MATDRSQRRIDRLMDQIDKAADRRDRANVSQLTQEVLVLDPGNTGATNFLGAAARARNIQPMERVLSRREILRA